jgi:hypothetical protein
MTSLTPLAAALLLFAGQARAQDKDATTIDHGPILLIVHSGVLIVPMVNVIVRDEKDKQLALSLLLASCPKDMGATPDVRFPELLQVGVPEPMTVDDYVDRQKQLLEMRGLKGDKLQEAVAKLQAKIQSDLSKHFAIVERFEKTAAPSGPGGMSDP